MLRERVEMGGNTDQEVGQAIGEANRAGRQGIIVFTGPHELATLLAAAQMNACSIAAASSSHRRKSRRPTQWLSVQQTL
jgi:hypothetical protein